MTTGPLTGIRVVEVADWVMVPSSAALLADWGADVIKVETPNGDAMRGFLGSSRDDAVDMTAIQFEQLNRGKRSIVADLGTPQGQTVLNALVRSADVVVTSLLPATRERFGLASEALRAVNPSVIVASSSGTGPDGPEAGQGGYDYSTFWARSGLAHSFHHPDLEYPIGVGGGLGDLISGMALAGAIAAAVAQRDRTGHASTVDVSLLGAGIWLTAFDVLAALHGVRKRRVAVQPHDEPLLALVNYYRTADDRFIVLTIPNPERAWPDLCRRIVLPHLITDARFADDHARANHRAELVAVLDAAFGAHPADEWRRRFDGSTFVWSIAQNPTEVAVDPQVRANGMIASVDDLGDSTHRLPELVSSYARFDGSRPVLRRAPRIGENSSDILRELGLSTVDGPLCNQVI